MRNIRFPFATLIAFSSNSQHTVTGTADVKEVGYCDINILVFHN